MRQVKTNYPVLVVLALVTIFCGAWYLKSSIEQTIYESMKPVATAEIGDTKLSVYSWNLFKTGQMWSLVSMKHKLELNFAPSLVTTAIAHTPGATEVSKSVEAPLVSMVQAAAADGVNLMLSSAYRSVADQQALYDALLALQGSEYVHEYVANPGASEHQTGLAVDLASVTGGCAIDANTCSLDASGIAWLRTHAAQYGFIERYPSGKQSITGVAGEHWHYRYVGVPLAKALTNAGMTLDEFVSQIAPGYSE